MSGSRAGSQQFPECAGLENPNRSGILNREGIAIARHQHVGVPGDRGGEDPSIGRIANGRRSWRSRLGKAWKWCKNGVDGREAIRRHLELTGQDSPQLLQNDLADDQVVFGKDSAEDIRAQAPGGERRNEDVGVEADPHEELRDGAKDVLVGEIAPRFGKGHHRAPRVLELEDGEVPAEGVARDVAAGAAGPLGEGGELALEGAVEPDGQRGGLHVRQCMTWTLAQQPEPSIQPYGDSLCAVLRQGSTANP